MSHATQLRGQDHLKKRENNKIPRGVLSHKCEERNTIGLRCRGGRVYVECVELKIFVAGDGRQYGTLAKDEVRVQNRRSRPIEVE